jgi:hypothetical protein
MKLTKDKTNKVIGANRPTAAHLYSVQTNPAIVEMTNNMKMIIVNDMIVSVVYMAMMIAIPIKITRNIT